MLSGFDRPRLGRLLGGVKARQGGHLMVIPFITGGGVVNHCPRPHHRGGPQLLLRDANLDAAIWPIGKNRQPLIAGRRVPGRGRPAASVLLPGHPSTVAPTNSQPWRTDNPLKREPCNASGCGGSVHHLLHPSCHDMLDQVIENDRHDHLGVRRECQGSQN